MKQLIDNAKTKMNKCVESLEHAYKDIRTSGANPNMVGNVEVEYYGFPTPLNEIAQIMIPEPRQIMIKPYEREALSLIEKAIRDSNLGLVPNNDGTVIRLNIPALSEERRKEYCKLCGKLSEAAKVSVRNIRRNANETLKRDKTMPEDQRRRVEQDVQKATDEFIKKIDQLASAKEKEIMTI
jgi:ribosome recycling factor